MRITFCNVIKQEIAIMCPDIFLFLPFKASRFTLQTFFSFLQSCKLNRLGLHCRENYIPCTYLKNKETGRRWLKILSGLLVIVGILQWKRSSQEILQLMFFSPKTPGEFTISCFKPNALWSSLKRGEKSLSVINTRHICINGRVTTLNITEECNS